VLFRGRSGEARQCDMPISDEKFEVIALLVDKLWVNHSANLIPAAQTGSVK